MWEFIKRNIQWIIFIVMVSSLSCFVIFAGTYYISIPLAVLTVILYGIGLSNSLKRWSESNERAYYRILLKKRFWED
jgi:hypothetical protein